MSRHDTPPDPPVRPVSPNAGAVPPGPEAAAARPDWLDFLEEEEWSAFLDVHGRASAKGIGLLLGGGLALAAYTPLRRRTKDIDFYALPSQREAIVALLNEAGFDDLYDRLPYDRGWIYRGVRGEVIVDIIWCFANYLTEVDEAWFVHSHLMESGEARGFSFRVVPPEELIFSKLFVFQRERCDWPDLLNLIYYADKTLDWPRLRARLGPHAPLLDGLLCVLRWLCPGRSFEGQPPADRSDEAWWEDRVRLFDSRDWFLPQIIAKSAS